MTTYVEEFASRLRELKQRSGRTYGVLAARMHVSTSTLHRYCNGAAVPTEYAPVERFARLCGAGPEELVALHRQWLLASAARRREQYHPTAGPGGTIEASGPGEPDAAGPEAVEPEDVGLGDAALGDVGPEAVEPEDADVTAGAVPADPAYIRPAADGFGSADVPRSGAPAPRSPWRRRATVAVGAVAAMAAVLPLVLHSAHGDGRSRDPAAHPRVPATVVGTPAATVAPESPSPSTTAPARKTTPATSPTKAPAEDSGTPPVQVTVLSDNWDTPCGQWFLMPQQPGKVPPPPSLQQAGAWAGALGGVPAGDLRLQLTAQKVSGQPVVLHALYVRVVSSTTAPKGNGYTPGSGCGGGLDPASFAVDLDTAAPRAHPVRGYVDDGSSPVLSDFPYQVGGDAQVLDVDAHTSDRDVSWYLELVWSCGDRQGTLRVDDHGRPFRTVGLKNDPTYFYDGDAWSPSSPQS